MTCEIHNDSTVQGSDRREVIDPIIQDLPEFQGGTGRHLCVYCAFDAGYRTALHYVREKLVELDDEFT